MILIAPFFGLWVSSWEEKMRLMRFVFVLGILSTVQLPWLAASTAIYKEPPPLNISTYGGFREDQLKFHIGGEGHHTKNFSKVEWRNLKIAQIGGSINYSTCHHYYMRATGAYGRIMDGDGSVTNEWRVCPDRHDHKHHHDIHDQQQAPHGYDHDHQKSWTDVNDCNQHHHHHLSHHEISKQKANDVTGYVCDASGAVGWKVISGGQRAWIAGFIGYSYDRQSLKMKNFKQTKDTLHQIVPAALEGVKGDYLTRWTGPFIGFDFLGMVECNVRYFGTFEWHVCDYRAEGVWKRCPSYKASIRHHARGYGAVASLGFDWAPCDSWGFGLLGNYQQWSTRRGNNHSKSQSLLYPSSHLPQSFPVAQKSRLYRVKWTSYSLSFLVSYRY